mmetsp:Transcript_10566/g.28095  ORF Transcript_10566/g.28095 Transcript_10566/m.28095 type:complete len:218 (+) Transcript_10566:266-919(+)
MTPSLRLPTGQTSSGTDMQIHFHKSTPAPARSQQPYQLTQHNVAAPRRRRARHVHRFQRELVQVLLRVRLPKRAGREADGRDAARPARVGCRCARGRARRRRRRERHAAARRPHLPVSSHELAVVVVARRVFGGVFGGGCRQRRRPRRVVEASALRDVRPCRQRRRVHRARCVRRGWFRMQRRQRRFDWAALGDRRAVGQRREAPALLVPEPQRVRA